MRKRERKRPPASRLSGTHRWLPIQKKGRQRRVSQGWHKWQEAYQRQFHTRLPDGSTNIVLTSSQADDLVKLLEVLFAEIPVALSNPNPTSMSKLHSLFHQFRSLFFTIPLPASYAESNYSRIDHILSLLHSFPYSTLALTGGIQSWLNGLYIIFTELHTGEVDKEKLLNTLIPAIEQVKDSYSKSNEGGILFPESFIQPFIHLLQNLPVSICLALDNKDPDFVGRLQNMVSQLTSVFSQIRPDPDSLSIIHALNDRVQTLLHQHPFPVEELVPQLSSFFHEIYVRLPLSNVPSPAKQTITTLFQSVQHSIEKVSGNPGNG